VERSIAVAATSRPGAGWKRMPPRGVCGAAVAAFGCGGAKTLPVTGSVRLVDGTPVAGATVVFESSQHRVSPSGTTDASGGFTLTAFTRNDGAPPGDYRIAVHPPMAADSSERQPRSPFDERYASASTSGLSFKVAPGATACELVLEPGTRR
jgi:hypothetical protein